MLLCERKAIPRERSWHFEINHDGYCWHYRQHATDPATGERDPLVPGLVTTPSCRARAAQPKIPQQGTLQDRRHRLIKPARPKRAIFRERDKANLTCFTIG